MFLRAGADGASQVINPLVTKTVTLLAKTVTKKVISVTKTDTK